MSAASLAKPRRRRNVLLLLLLLAFVAFVYSASFSHVGEEAGPPSGTSAERQP